MKQQEVKKKIILCNGAKLPERKRQEFKGDFIDLCHSPGTNKQNVKVQLPDFVRSINYLPDRLKDLLELAGYIYAADRNLSRGQIDSLEYQNWARDIHLIIPVRDFLFWNDDRVKALLSESLEFMSGDRKWNFTFLQGTPEFPMNLFDKKEFQISQEERRSVVLFSGGLDSLSGVVERLKKTNEQICLVSHQSGQPETIKTQKVLLELLNKDFNNRCKHFKFSCSLKGKRGREETQRTRSFLYSSIAFALARSYDQEEFYFYENGVTSINFSKRQDLINARASRTTHPKTLGLLQQFFDLFDERPIRIKHPYLFFTKADVVLKLHSFGKGNYINNAVSCSRTFLNTSEFTHCGGCSQCVDRRFSMFASEIEDFDNQGLYEVDFINEDVTDGRIKTTLIDHIRLGLEFCKDGLNTFYDKRFSDFVDLDDYIDGEDEEEKASLIYGLCHKHGKQVEKAIERIRNTYDKPYKKRHGDNLISIIAEKEYLKTPSERLALTICKKLNRSLPIAFRKNKPLSENDFNDKMNAILESEHEKYEREFPCIRFASANTVPDHAINGHDILIESKYLRKNTTPSKITDEIGADLHKYPSSSLKIFVIYDPDRSISDDEKFIKEFEKFGNCIVNIVR